MTRTLITIADEDKNWLMRYAKEKHVSMAELIRQAIQEYRQRIENEAQTSHFEDLLSV